MFDDHHMSRAHYEMLMRGELPPRRLLYRLFRHLLAVCPVCAQHWQDFLEPGGGRGPLPRRERATCRSTHDEASSIDEIFARSGELFHRAKEDQRNARGLLDELLALPTLKDRVARVRRSRRFRSWALCDLLFEESRAVSFRDPPAGEALAELALEAAWCLENSGLSRETVADLLARGWATLANARRMTSDLLLAEETFLLSYFFLDQGTGDPSVQAEVLNLDASLQRDLRHFELALKLLNKVVAIHRRSGESHLQGRALLKMAITQAEAGDLVAALRIIRRGVRLITPDREPRLSLCFRHTEVLYINQLGDHQEAAGRMEELALLYAQFPDAWTQLRRRWLLGEIAEGLGDLEQAEEEYRQVRAGFIEQGIGYDAALVSLNLAALFAQQGRTQEIQTLAAQMLRIFESRDVHREAIAALILFQKAAKAEAVTLQMAREMSSYLKRARNNPKMRFEQPS